MSAETYRLQCTCGGPRNTLESWLSPPTVGARDQLHVVENKCFYPLSHLTAIRVCVYIIYVNGFKITNK